MKLGPIIRLCTATRYISSYCMSYCEVAVHEESQVYREESTVDLGKVMEKNE